MAKAGAGAGCLRINLAGDVRCPKRFHMEGRFSVSFSLISSVWTMTDRPSCPFFLDGAKREDRHRSLRSVRADTDESDEERREATDPTATSRIAKKNTLICQW